MHASEDIRIVKCVDGLHYSFEIVKAVYGPLYDVCKSLPEDNGALIEAIWRCWSFVDTVQRIREISQALPGLSRKAPALKAFLHETQVVEDYRHYIQHLRTELSKKDPNPFPVWGSLSWVDAVDDSRFHIVLAGAQLGNTSYTGCVFDVRKGTWTSRVCLGAAGLSLNFDPLYDAVLTFEDFVLPWAFDTYKPGIKLTSELQIVTGTMRLTHGKPDKQSKPE